MDNSVNISVSSAQLFLSLLFQLWIIIFPIIIIKKLNYLTNLLEEHYNSEQEA